MIEVTSDEAVVLDSTSAANPKPCKLPPKMDLFNQRDILDEGEGDSDEATKKTHPGAGISEEDRDTRLRRNRTAPAKIRSLSPIRRNPYAPPAAQGQQPYRRCNSTSHDARRQKSPNRTGSNNVVRDMLELVGFPLEEEEQQEEEQNDDDNYDDYKVSDSEIQTLVNDHDEFLRLKRALKAKGAVTNEMLRQRLHVYVHKNRDRIQRSSHHSSATAGPRGSDCSASSSAASLWFGMSG